jgi:hypothetical protein
MMGLLCCISIQGSRVNSAKAPDGPQTYTLNVLWIQKGGAQVCMLSKFHIHIECGLRFQTLLHTFYTVDCLTASLGEDIFSTYYVQ